MTTSLGHRYAAEKGIITGLYILNKVKNDAFAGDLCNFVSSKIIYQTNESDQYSKDVLPEPHARA